MRSLGRSFRALGSQHIIAVASMLAACGAETPVTPTTNGQNLAGEAPDDSEVVSGEEAAGGLEGAAVDEGRAIDLGEAPVNADTGGLPPDAVAPEAGAYTQYIAFGDSFTSGFGLAGTDPRTCAQSLSAWPPQVNGILGIASPLIFAACSGATTQDVLANGPLVGTTQSAPQIAQLPPPEQLDSALITIQIGGNDIRLDASMQECIQGLNALKMSTDLTGSLTALRQLPPQCADLDWLLNNLSVIANTSLLPSLDSTFTSLRQAAPNAVIVAVGYPHLVSATSACTGLWASISLDYRQRMNDLADAINAQIASAAANAGILSLTTEVVAAFSDREACSPQEMIDSFNMHPNAAGHEAYAQLVANGLPAPPTRTAVTDEAAVPPTNTIPPDAAAAAGEGVAGQQGVGANPPVDGVGEQPPAEGDSQEPQGAGDGEQPPAEGDSQEPPAEGDSQEDNGQERAD